MTSKNVIHDDIEYSLTWPAPTPAQMADSEAYWIRQNILPPGVSPAERSKELLMIAKDTVSAEVVGVATANLVRVPEIGEMFYAYRNHVSPSYRKRQIGTHLPIESFIHLEQYNLELARPEAVGVYMEVGNLSVMQAQNAAVWATTRFNFIGKTPQGHDRRIRYFRHAESGST